MQWLINPNIDKFEQFPSFLILISPIVEPSIASITITSLSARASNEIKMLVSFFNSKQFSNL